jgi:hypothetical protein
MEIELMRCKTSPYYFATKYLKIMTSTGKFIPYTTRLTESQFNALCQKLKQQS